MSGVTKAAARGVLAVSILLVLAVPAQAKPREGGKWFDRAFDPIMKVVKKFAIRTLGDGLIDPRP